MLTYILVVLVSLLFMMLFVIAIYFGRTPTYRVSQQQLQSLLQQVLDGECQYEVWLDFLSLPILHNNNLESIRHKLVLIQQSYGFERRNHAGFLLNTDGLLQIQRILRQFEQDGRKMF